MRRLPASWRKVHLKCELSREQPALMFEETPEYDGSQPFKYVQLSAPVTSVLPGGCLRVW